MDRGWRIGVDTGGTFTDCLFETPERQRFRGKVLSNGSVRLRVQAIDVLDHLPLVSLTLANLPETLLPVLTGKEVWCAGHRLGPIELADEQTIVVAIDSTCAVPQAGAIIEIRMDMEAPLLALHQYAPEILHSSAPVELRVGTTKGTNTLLENKGAPVAVLLSTGFGDLLLIRDQKRPDLFAHAIERPVPFHRCAFEIGGRIATDGTELVPLDTAAIHNAAQTALAEGCTVVAVCLLNSWRNPSHEQAATEILRQYPFAAVCSSAELVPRIHYLNRAESTVVNATLEPVLKSYLDRIEAPLRHQQLKIMTSSGGLVGRKEFRAMDSMVSGPAGGVMGAVSAAQRCGFDAILTLDMGGTSTDVSRWHGTSLLQNHVKVSAASILTPSLRIETVAAGGGSICEWRQSGLQVGPQSAGAEPGPAAYGAGGPLTLTDVHLLLGRIDGERFGIPLDLPAAQMAMHKLAADSGMGDWRQLAQGLLHIANERMAQAIRTVSSREGADPADYALVVYGGAGGLHACAIADDLGIRNIIYPKDAGLLSARGIQESSTESIVAEQILLAFEDAVSELPDSFQRLESVASQKLAQSDIPPVRQCVLERSVEMRLRGQDFTLSVNWSTATDAGGEYLRTAYQKQFSKVFGYFPESADLEIVSLRLRMAESRAETVPQAFPSTRQLQQGHRQLHQPTDGDPQHSIPVYDREQLEPGDNFMGPALICDPHGTFFLEANWRAQTGDSGDLLMQCITKPAAQQVDLHNPIRHALMRHRFEALVTEMGNQLQRTALSTNIRERMDFSCAVLDAEGRLLINAPHIPVHLGAMGECVRHLSQHFAFKPGDVVITNHPQAGGSHLPDITMVTALHDAEGNRIGYLANRAHHAELGGLQPGSMPVGATCLAEEGVVIPPQLMVSNGKLNHATIQHLLTQSDWPSRSPNENQIDLQAQLASLQRGKDLFHSILHMCGCAAIRDFFHHLHQLASQLVREKLRTCPPRHVNLVEHLDDGARIQIQLHMAQDGIRIDFAGTDPVQAGNFNATPAIVRSVVLYVLRLWLNHDIPLNEGILDAVHIELPVCLLNPPFTDDPKQCPAVVGGNTETSQRLADALLRALEIMAGGHASMNNFLFGTDRFGYYETIGGGAAAGPGFHGASGVHVHMTNTAITDPEILEHRYPVRCLQFAIRTGSGGKGTFNGGDGLLRAIEFLEPVTVSLLTQNRSQAPRGCAGGGDGQQGEQWLQRQDGTRLPLPPTASINVQPGESIHIATPGAGAWGRTS